MFLQALWNGNYLWASPLNIIITVFLLFREIKWTVVGGIITLIVILILQAKLGKYQSNLRTKALKFTDTRISLLTKLLVGIRVWKINGWEYKISNQVEEARKQEIKLLRKIAFISAISSTIITSGPVLITLIVFVLYGALYDDPLTVSKAFTSLTLFNMLKAPLYILPSIFVSALNSCVALDRVYEFLAGENNSVSINN